MAILFTDHNFSAKIAAYPVSGGHQVITADEVSFARATDEEVLLHASLYDQVLVTFNGTDFSLLHDAWHRWSGGWGVTPAHAGIVIVPQRWEPAFAGQELLALLDCILPATNTLHLWRPEEGGVSYPQARPSRRTGL